MTTTTASASASVTTTMISIITQLMALSLLLGVALITTTTTTTTHAFVQVQQQNNNCNNSPHTITSSSSVVLSSSSSSSLSSTTADTTASDDISSAEEALQRTRTQVQRMQQQQDNNSGDADDVDDSGSKGANPIIDQKFKEYVLYPANALKKELKKVGLYTKGKKPDLARRLAEYEYRLDHPDAPAYYTNAEIGNKVTKKGGNRKKGDAESTTRKPSTYLEPKEKSEKKNETKKNSNSRVKEIKTNTNINNFCGIVLSEVASQALNKAQFIATPTPIQANGLPYMMNGQGPSCILHAETGSGKTLAYLLPITEAMWAEENDDMDTNQGFEGDSSQNELRYGFILTPTRELAAQVAGVATALSPPGSVRLISHPTDLMSESRYWKERRGSRTTDPDAIDLFVEEDMRSGRSAPPRLFIGSAKSILHSLYGDGRMPASPTRRPMAKELLSKTRWIVLDEVDRLLNVKSQKGLTSSGTNRRTRNAPIGSASSSSKAKRNTNHEKPAAILASAITKRTMGRAQVIAASATVGRNLKRELSRILGLSPKEYPRVIQGTTADDIDNDDDDDDNDSVSSTTTTTTTTATTTNHVNRAITIPRSVTNYIVSVDTSSTGKLLTDAFFVIKNLNKSKKKNSNKKTLVVLSKGCGISTKNAVGALTHFGLQPEPQSLLDVLQNADGSDQLMDVHRRVTGITQSGIGESDLDETTYFDNEDINSSVDDEDDTDTTDDTSNENTDDSYLLVTGEDTVRGMHLAGLDTVIVVGRPAGPDEYIHIAGRTGRAGRKGKVISVVSEAHAQAIASWSTMLNVDFLTLDSINDVSNL